VEERLPYALVTLDSKQMATVGVGGTQLSGLAMLQLCTEKYANGHIVIDAIRVAECGLHRFRTKLCLFACLATLVGGLDVARMSAQSCSDEVISQNRAATVFISVKQTLKVTGQVEERTGTGFVISPSGYVLTNKHVIEADAKVDEIEIAGAIASREAFPSRLILIQANEHDVALLKFSDTSKTYRSVALGQTASLKVGTHLCSEGFPANQEYFFVEGPLSSTGAERGFWLTQMPSNPGDSGAPVFLTSGEVVAIKVGGYEGLQNVNLLIPINLAQDLVILSDASHPSLPAPVANNQVPDKSFVTRLTVWAEIDGDVFVDGRKSMTIDHRSGFDYAGARVRIGPESTITIRSRGVEKSGRLWDLCRSNAEGCEVRVGTEQLSDISITEEEKRASMGSSTDVLSLLNDLSKSVSSSTRAWTAERLGYIGDKVAIPGLVVALADPNPYVEAVVALALARIGDPVVLPELRAAYNRYGQKQSYGYMFEGAIKDLEFAAKHR
jgi:V8-like Glu-specific endopeptidase